MANFKAIETFYHGCRFRSRTEARWAVFFDTLGISWEYEKEGYILEGMRYLPDFWLPEQDCFVEIKGQEPNGDELVKARLLSLYTQKIVCILYGPVEIPSGELLNSYFFLPPSVWKYREDERLPGGPSTTKMDIPSHILAIMQGLWDHNIQFSVEPDDGEMTFFAVIDTFLSRDIDSLIEDLKTQAVGLQNYKDRIETHKEEIKDVLSLEPGWTYDYLSQSDFDEDCRWLECKRCGAFEIGTVVKKKHKCHDGIEGDLAQLTPRIQEAYTAARSARFEFGEKGR
jgi:hypothetical protein